MQIKCLFSLLRSQVTSQPKRSGRRWSYQRPLDYFLFGVSLTNPHRLSLHREGSSPCRPTTRAVLGVAARGRYPHRRVSRHWDRTRVYGCATQIFFIFYFFYSKQNSAAATNKTNFINNSNARCFDATDEVRRIIKYTVR